MRIAALFTLAFLLSALAVNADVATVRREIEAQYAKLAEANEKKDIAAVMALKSDTFYTIGPKGELNDRLSMQEYSRRFLEPLLPPIVIHDTIRDLKVSQNELVAVATVFQEVSRYRELAGKKRKIETSVVQRETWVKTADGWKLQFVDDVHDQITIVDGKRVDPTKPYDPDAPPYQQK
jgi:SnoaL-like domain